MQWNIYEDRQSAYLTVQIQDEARRQGLETEFSRVGWTTSVAVKCTVEQWDALLARVKEDRP